MIVIVDERELVCQGYASLFAKEGHAVEKHDPNSFNQWVETARPDELEATDAFFIGQCAGDAELIRAVKSRTRQPLIALIETYNLAETLRLFEAGADDVVRKPVHARELLARIAVIRRRQDALRLAVEVGRLRVRLDGRDPEIDGQPFPLPRRERRILEYLASIGERRATKTQVFSAIYGVFEPDIDENVVESHISKLRKKLRSTLGFDPIDSKRFLGYRLTAHPEAAAYG